MNVLDYARDYVYTVVGLADLVRMGIDMRRKQREQARAAGNGQGTGTTGAGAAASDGQKSAAPA